MGFSSNYKLLALPTNVRLGRKWLTVTNTLAYYGTESITALKSFIAKARGPRLTICAALKLFDLDFWTKDQEQQQQQQRHSLPKEAITIGTRPNSRGFPDRGWDSCGIALLTWHCDIWSQVLLPYSLKVLKAEVGLEPLTLERWVECSTTLLPNSSS